MQIICMIGLAFAATSDLLFIIIVMRGNHLLLLLFFFHSKLFAEIGTADLLGRVGILVFIPFTA